MTSTKSIAEHLRKSDLQGLEHFVFLSNLTSQTQIIKKHLISLIEINEKGLSLELPTNTCQKGHFLTLILLTPDKIDKFKSERFEQLLKTKGAIIVDGKVIEYTVDINNPLKSNVAIDLTQFDAKMWGELKKAYENHQNKLQSIAEQLKTKVVNE